MNVFVTGASGFIGKRLVAKLLRREDVAIFALAARQRRPRRLRTIARGVGRRGWARRRRSRGDILQPTSASAPKDATALKGRSRSLFPPRRGLRPRGGSRNSSRRRMSRACAMRSPSPKTIGARHFHHVSSIAAAGLYDGTFPRRHVRGGAPPRPSLFQDQARRRSVWCARRKTVPWRIYRPGIVVGDFAHRRNGQDRRPLLLLQAHPETAQRSARLGSADRPRRRPDQRRAGRLRRRRARPSWRFSKATTAKLSI